MRGGSRVDATSLVLGDVDEPDEHEPPLLGRNREVPALDRLRRGELCPLVPLVLAAVGLYGVVSYGVATRTNEFGIRMALGARARDVVRMVLSGTFWNVGAGLAVGIVLCLLVDRLASQWVAESSKDPLILGGVTLVLLAVAIVACFAPARRAAAIDPMEAVRHE